MDQRLCGNSRRKEGRLMNRMTKAILAIFFIAVITVSMVSITRQIGKSLRLDITDQKLYTLSDGTRQILDGLKQPITIKLFYSQAASMKAPDQIRFFSNYYEYVRAVLEEYVSQSKGMVKLEVIDPRPYSEEEMAAIRYGLKQFNISQEEKFFFGLVVQTQFGVTKIIEFFTPDRQNFVEYDISYLIDTAMTRQKSRVGILSSLPVVGDDTSGYMAYMMKMQGQQPRPAWGLAQQLKQKYEVSSIPADTETISGIDILMVIHPKKLPDKTLFAIDQYILNGGRAIIFVDPHCVIDRPSPQAQFDPQMSMESNLEPLFKTWGIEMPSMTFAGDVALAETGAVSPNGRSEKILGILTLTKKEKCFNPDSPVTAMLNTITMMFPGVLKKLSAESKDNAPLGIQYAPLLKTTSKGNAWKVENIYELMNPDYAEFLRRFREGTEPVVMGYMLTGKFKSAFPEGVEFEEKSPQSDPKKTQQQPPVKKKLTGIAQAKESCAVAVFADVDFISDIVAYRSHPLFGMMVVGDNSSLVLNTLDDLCGSTALMAVRSRGSYSRPFEKVDKIEEEAAARTAEKESEIQKQIKGFEQELNSKLASLDKNENELINKTILADKRDIELKLREAEKNLRDVKMSKVQQIEKLGLRLKNFCMLPGPVLVLVLAIGLGLRRSFKRRNYISHASDS
jgi:ABC-2 type transport system permease protein